LFEFVVNHTIVQQAMAGLDWEKKKCPWAHGLCTVWAQKIMDRDNPPD